MKKILLPIILFTAIFHSCQKDPDIEGDWQESYAAYCLLNLKDTVQYIRINRVFYSSDDPANYFQVPDSVNVDPDIMAVSMVSLLDGEPDGDSVVFTPTDAFPKDEGLFSSETYFVFKSTCLLKADRTYRITIRNTETGFKMKAETGLLGNRPLSYSFTETRYYNINQYQPEVIDYEGSLITSQFDKRIIRLVYYEYQGDQKVMKYCDWRSPYTKAFETGREDTAQLSDDLFGYFAENIPVIPGIKRKAVGIDKMLVINDEMVSLFIGYSENLSSGQYIPGLSNFDHGVGLFASRYYYTFFAMGLKPKTIDSLAYGRFTKELGFADSGGTGRHQQLSNNVCKKATSCNSHGCVNHAGRLNTPWTAEHPERLCL